MGSPLPTSYSPGPCRPLALPARLPCDSLCPLITTILILYFGGGSADASIFHTDSYFLLCYLFGIKTTAFHVTTHFTDMKSEDAEKLRNAR